MINYYVNMATQLENMLGINVWYWLFILKPSVV